jgi:hypothetical protein
MNGDGEQKRPILRWTFGPCYNNGLLILLESIRRAQIIYGDIFDLVVVHNGQTEDKLAKIADTGIRMVAADPTSLPIPPSACKWKLYPPRLDISVHEIVIDNDWVFTKRLPIIDLFLKDDATMIYEGLHGEHGSFKHMVPEVISVNSGCYGMPPGYDFCEEIRKLLIATGHKKWKDHFDDQGVVGGTLPYYPRMYVVLQRDIPCLGPYSYEGLPSDAYGYHFVSANQNNPHPLLFRFLKRIFFY